MTLNYEKGTPANITPITTAEPIEDEKLEAYLEAFCDWIDVGLPKGVLNYER